MENGKYHLIALSQTRAGFFDPVTKVNLTRLNPQAPIPAGIPVSGSIRAALYSGGIIDVNGTLWEQLRAEEETTESFRPLENEQEDNEDVRDIETPEDTQEFLEKDIKKRKPRARTKTGS